MVHHSVKIEEFELCGLWFQIYTKFEIDQGHPNQPNAEAKASDFCVTYKLQKI